MKTAELTGALLDYHTARAEGIPAEQLEIREVPRTDLKICVRGGLVVANYSSNWALAGPLLEKHKMGCEFVDGYWIAITAAPSMRAGAFGAQGFDIFKPMIAICRAVVRQAFGDEVGDLP